MTETLMDKMPATPDLNRERLEQLKALMPDLASGAANGPPGWN